ncbi:hypothetical protein [Vibrio breoganii]|uniref:hypothetical protein n=1 Tax=Vibrio breoganii TaxID=553239 RepID=UPI000C85B3F8|nr:hypothetical protein [Vibrio breoganii]PMH17712.1 hypothetical protein BCU74_11025 [Vibrio breoganii]PMM13923.1 hypothetical protein BCT60_11565 [Vibrio breoganii]
MELRRFSTAAAIIGTTFAPTYSFATSFELPIWKSEAEERGYVLPKAFGISVGYMHVEQGINVKSIDLNGIKSSINTPDIPGYCYPIPNTGICIPIFDDIPSQNIPINSIDVETIGGFQESDVWTVRADMWLFPFLNFYAIAGKITGYSETDIKVTLDVGQNNRQITTPQLPFRLDLDGNMYGGGFVVAGGYEEWFTIIDASYTKTNLTVIDGGIDSIVVTPRVGYDFTNYGHPVRIWVGGQYQNIQQTLKGNLSDIFGAQVAAALSEDGVDAQFVVEQELASEWNTVVGFNYVINPTFNIIGEFGFGERQSAFISLDTRF